MKSYYDKENECNLKFNELGDCYHLWTPENFEIIFTDDESFKKGMGAIGIASMMTPGVRVLTFEIMSNHLHITASGPLPDLLNMFNMIVRMLKLYFQERGRTIDWSKFSPGTRKLENLEDLRNVIVYVNRNGYIVCPDHSPFSYPWGANKYYFNTDAKMLAMKEARIMSGRERRSISRSHVTDAIADLKTRDGYALPLSFCDIESGEMLFRDESHYFYKLSRSIENDKKIAKEIGESIFYTDDELYAATCRICKDRYNGSTLTSIPAENRIELARILHYEYNASPKRIQRLLKLSPQTLQSLGPDFTSDFG